LTTNTNPPNGSSGPIALNASREIERLRRAQDAWADSITGSAGSLRFVRLHIAWFIAWIAVNVGILGVAREFDPYPFGLLTLVVSLEAIFLSTFVMISQNRKAHASEIRAELDYRTNVMAEREIDVVMLALQRIAESQGIVVEDLIVEIREVRRELVTTPDRD
jgi:uncharacterized membrane protein